MALLLPPLKLLTPSAAEAYRRLSTARQAGCNRAHSREGSEMCVLLCLFILGGHSAIHSQNKNKIKQYPKLYIYSANTTLQFRVAALVISSRFLLMSYV